MTADRATNRPTPYVGDQPTVWVDAVDKNGIPTNPLDGRLLIQQPGATTSDEIVFGDLVVAPDGVTGRVEYTFPTPIAVAGLWKFYWEFTNGINAAEPFSLRVKERTVPLPAP